MPNSDLPPASREISKTYADARTSLTQALLTAFSVSQAARDLPSNRQAREYWASVLFARMCGFGGSLHRLLPESVANPQGTVYDFASAAAICRSLFEAYLSFLYLCSPKLTSDQYIMRLRLVQLHDCTRRPEILRKIGGTPDDEWFAGQATVLREDLQKNSEFVQLEDRRQAELLKGRLPTHLTQDEILAAEGGDITSIRGIYEFLSSHTHSYPFSYWRTPEHGERGTGRENDVEKGYLAIAAQLASELLNAGADQMKQVFSTVTKYPRWRIDWDSMTGSPLGSGYHFGSEPQRPPMPPSAG
jgi:Family of unknown function (DUF5677)